MEKEFVPYEIALALKELGFYEHCFKVKLKHKPQFDYTQSDYDDFPEQKELEVVIPLYQQAFRWFREKHSLHYIVCKNIQIDGYGYREVIQIHYMEENKNTIFKTYEEAELECLKKLTEIVKEKWLWKKSL